MSNRKKISGYEGYTISGDGSVFNEKLQRPLKGRVGKNGYKNFVLTKNGNSTRFYAHRLIAEAFIPNPENKPCINHKNGIKTDNRIENLEWCTYSENIQHAYDNGLRTYNVPDNSGENHGSSKLTDNDVLDIRNAYPLGFTQQQMADAYGVSRSLIGGILRGDRWSHI